MFNNSSESEVSSSIGRPESTIIIKTMAWTSSASDSGLQTWEVGPKALNRFRGTELVTLAT